MKIIIGLGNPGKEYVNTRHNVGFRVVEELAGEKKWGKSKSGSQLYASITIGSDKIELIKPMKFMNNSGQAVKEVVSKHKVSSNDLYVIHDDLDISLGKFKIQSGRGPRKHNGLESIYQTLKKKDFWHVRLGIDNRQGDENRIPGEAYVLGKFKEEEEKVIEGLVNNVANELRKRLEV